ncbi:hypothetical protein B0H16DRAFT_1572476, partial [Mycena metata]
DSIDAPVKTENENEMKLTFIRREQAGHHPKTHILLTVTPAEPLPDNFTPIVWKVCSLFIALHACDVPLILAQLLTFDISEYLVTRSVHGSDDRTDTPKKTLIWTGKFGFSTIHQQKDNSFISDSAAEMKIGEMARLILVDGKPQWSALEQGDDRRQIAASNETLALVSLALFAVDDVGKSPMVHLGALKPSAIVASAIAVKLQAYAVSDNKVYTEGQIIEKRDLNFPLLTTDKDISAPYDLQGVRKDVEFSLESDYTGRMMMSLTSGKV